MGRWEPRKALNGGADGLDFCRRIAAEAWSHLARDGAGAWEIGAGIGAAAAKIFADVGCYSKVKIFLDYAGRERVVAAHQLEPRGIEPKGWR